MQKVVKGKIKKVVRIDKEKLRKPRKTKDDDTNTKNKKF